MRTMVMCNDVGDRWTLDVHTGHFRDTIYSKFHSEEAANRAAQELHEALDGQWPSCSDGCHQPRLLCTLGISGDSSLLFSWGNWRQIHTSPHDIDGTLSEWSPYIRCGNELLKGGEIFDTSGNPHLVAPEPGCERTPLVDAPISKGAIRMEVDVWNRLPAIVRDRSSKGSEVCLGIGSYDLVRVRGSRQYFRQTLNVMERLAAAGIPSCRNGCHLLLPEIRGGGGSSTIWNLEYIEEMVWYGWTLSDCRHHEHFCSACNVALLRDGLIAVNEITKLPVVGPIEE